jgi:hypothetical protein
MTAKHDFTLTFDLPDPHEDPSKYLDGLYEVGCNDATVGVGKRGSIALSFTREAESLEDAVRSALEEVAKVIPKARCR